jgi:hypothetical protein
MTKARTAAQKLRSRRGRPRLDAPRTPSGQISRSKEAYIEMNMQPAIDRRIRHYGIRSTKDTPAQILAGDPAWGYLLGRLLKDGAINKAQHDAGNRYAEDMASYFGLTGVPFPSAKAQNMFAVRGGTGDDNEDRGKMASKARAKMVKLREMLLACGDINTGRKVLHTVNAVCVEDMDHLRTLNSPMRAWLVSGLNSLSRFYEGT